MILAMAILVAIIVIGTAGPWLLFRATDQPDP
jgi:hypothetical protein